MCGAVVGAGAMDMRDADFNFQQVPNSKSGPELIGTHLGTTRKLILDSAKYLFARNGYEGTSLTLIAARAGVFPEDLPDHFPDKLAILMAVLEEGWVSINQRLQDIVIDSISARQATLSMIAVMMRILERDHDLARLLLFESRRTHPEDGEIVCSQGYRWFTQLCTELVVRGQKDGSFRVSLHPAAIASMITGALEGLLRDRYLAEEEGTATPFNGADVMTAFDSLVTHLGPERPLLRL